jgi:hypothetical protein
MGILRVDIDRNFLRRTMVHTRASEAASSSVARQQPCRAPLQEAQDPESEPKVVMEDVEVTMSPEIGQFLVSRLERPVPPRTRRTLSWYTTTPVYGGIRSGADTSVTTIGARSLSRGEPP